MHLLGQSALGIVMLLLLVMLVVIKQLATGSILEKPKGMLRVRLVNVFNLFFLLVVLPVTAILLITCRMEVFDPSHLTINSPSLLLGLEIAGMVLYVSGYFLMSWALISLGGNYQLGGSSPRSGDEMVSIGPYRLVRHPMYTAVLCISLGLALLAQSSALFLVFCIYLVLIISLIPVEEAGLKQVYGEKYTAFQRKVKKLVPFCY